MLLALLAVVYASFTRQAFFIRTLGKSKTKECENMSGFSYKEQYAVVVLCKDERDQEEIYNRLKEEGYKLKVVAV